MVFLMYILKIRIIFYYSLAGYMSVNTSILVDILGLQNIARSMGFFLVVGGLANIFSISSAGKSKEYYSYLSDSAFVMCS